MSKKKTNFIDQFLDKIVLAVAGLAALYLIWAFILSNPYGQKVDGRKVSPSQIDKQNQSRAKQIEQKLQGLASPNPYIQNKAEEFSDLVGSAISKVSSAVSWPLPDMGQSVGGENPIYVIPQIPALESLKYAAIRGTVRMPTEEITPEITYQSAAYKASDIDLVTFSAHLNVQTLINNFRQSFMGPRLKPQWKDSSFAEPVPVRVELQRSVQNPDGSWGAWETLPFSRINPFQKILKEIPLTTDQMTYGDVTLFMNSCREFAVMKSILQPDAYEFLSTTQWLPAEYYEEYRKISDEEESKRMREERDQRLRERETRGGGAAAGRPVPRTPQQPQPQPRRGARGGENPMEMGVPVRPVKATRTIQDVEKDFESVVLTDKSKISSLKDMVVWINDDTAVSGMTYRYRIRYGVFNPVAGKDWLAPESKDYKSHIVLWSDYVEFPESVTIPKMLHLFPIDVLANGAGVNVEMYKYFMGQWRTEAFEIYPGQRIGKQMDLKVDSMAGGFGAMMGGGGMLGGGMGGMEPTMPSQVDYSTGYMLMDVQVISDWSGTKVWLREMPLMLYLDENNQVQSMIAKRQYWPKEMTSEYSAIKTEMAKYNVGTEGIPGMGIPPGQPGRMMPIRDMGGM